MFGAIVSLATLSFSYQDSLPVRGRITRRALPIEYADPDRDGTYRAFVDASVGEVSDGGACLFPVLVVEEIAEDHIRLRDLAELDSSRKILLEELGLQDPSPIYPLGAWQVQIEAGDSAQLEAEYRGLASYRIQKAVADDDDWTLVLTLRYKAHERIPNLVAYVSAIREELLRWKATAQGSDWQSPHHLFDLRESGSRSRSRAGSARFLDLASDASVIVSLSRRMGTIIGEIDEQLVADLIQQMLAQVRESSENSLTDASVVRVVLSDMLSIQDTLGSIQRLVREETTDSTSFLRDLMDRAEAKAKEDYSSFQLAGGYGAGWGHVSTNNMSRSSFFERLATEREELSRSFSKLSAGFAGNVPTVAGLDLRDLGESDESSRLIQRLELSEFREAEDAFELVLTQVAEFVADDKHPHESQSFFCPHDCAEHQCNHSCKYHTCSHGCSSHSCNHGCPQHSCGHWCDSHECSHGCSGHRCSSSCSWEVARDSEYRAELASNYGDTGWKAFTGAALLPIPGGTQINITARANAGNTQRVRINTGGRSSIIDEKHKAFSWDPFPGLNGKDVRVPMNSTGTSVHLSVFTGAGPEKDTPARWRWRYEASNNRVSLELQGNEEGHSFNGGEDVRTTIVYIRP